MFFPENFWALPTNHMCAAQGSEGVEVFHSFAPLLSCAHVIFSDRLLYFVFPYVWPSARLSVQCNFLSNFRPSQEPV